LAGDPPSPKDDEVGGVDVGLIILRRGFKAIGHLVAPSIAMIGVRLLDQGDCPATPVPESKQGCDGKRARQGWSLRGHGFPPLATVPLRRDLFCASAMPDP
jgi:hypothetical protein